MANLIETIISFKKIETLNKYLIKDENGKIYFDFNEVIPEPQAKEECPKEYLIDENESNRDYKPWFNWYEWRLDNWGTKSNANYLEINDTDINFCTAWDAPYRVLEEICHQNPQEDIYFKIVDQEAVIEGFDNCIEEYKNVNGQFTPIENSNQKN